MTLPNVVIAFLMVTVLALFGQKAGFWAQPRPAVMAVAPPAASVAAVAAPVVAAAPVPVAPVPGAPVPGAPVPGAPVPGAPVAAAPPVAVAPVAVAPVAVAPGAVAPPAAVVAVAPPALPEGHETIDSLPPGPGREETFLACTACHNTALIRRSGFTRDRWDELMDWMVEKQAMNPLDPEMRTTIVDYLAGAFPQRQSPRGRNPFAAP